VGIGAAKRIKKVVLDWEEATLYVMPSANLEVAAANGGEGPDLQQRTIVYCGQALYCGRIHCGPI